MKNMQNWKEIERQEAADGSFRVIYEFKNYYIIVSNASYMPGGVSISAEAVDRDSYFPSIYISSSFGQSVQEIKIQTISWGALAIPEIDRVLECYTAAQVVAHEIEKAFPECFEEKEALRYKLMNEHRSLVRSGKLHEARRILHFLRTGYIRLWLDDISWSVEQVLESCGFHISINPRSGMASCSVNWGYENS